MTDLKESEIRAMISLLDDEDREVTQHVEHRLMDMGKPVIPLLENEWEVCPDPQLQQRIEDLIHRLQFDELKERLAQWYASEEKDLLEGMWLVASYLYPDLELQELRLTLNEVYMECWLAFKKDLHPFDQIKILNSIIFGRRFNFKSNTKNFHSPSNSMLNVVLDTHQGNPLTLSVIYLLVAQKLELPIYGVNLPNIFVLTYKADAVQFYINPFNKGLIFTKEDIENYISGLNLSPNPIYFEPCSNLDIIQRTYRNLIHSYKKDKNRQKVEELKELLEMITPAL